MTAYRMKCTSITDTETKKVKGEETSTRRVVLEGEDDLFGAKIVFVNTSTPFETGVYYNVEIDRKTEVKNDGEHA